jgi:formylmethanofuran dehydrogenase subunit C
MTRQNGRILKMFQAGQKGSAMILVLIFMALAALVVPPMLSYMGTGLKTGMVFEQKNMELYAAGSGIEDALWKIRYDPPENYPQTYELPETINSENVTVKIENVGWAFKITSTATSGSGTDTEIECYASFPFSIFDFAAASLSGNLTVSGNTMLDSWPDTGQADIYANGDIILQGGVEVRGSAYCSGDVYTSGSSHVTGNVTEHIPAYPFEELDTSEYLQEADSGTPFFGDLSITTSRDLGPAHIYGDLSISSSAIVTLGGTIWVNGTVKMSGGSHVEGAGTIIAEGNLSVTGGGSLEPADLPVFISVNGNITTAGNQQVSAVLYAPNGCATVSGTAGLFGAVTGKSVVIATSSTLSYGLELRARATHENPKIVIYMIR